MIPNFGDIEHWIKNETEKLIFIDFSFVVLIGTQQVVNLLFLNFKNYLSSMNSKRKKPDKILLNLSVCMYVTMSVRDNIMRVYEIFGGLK